ncbi:MAG: tRNA 2-thiocytidine(32) synthetase TtcA [Clostridia bacterium]|nr:tRNA 2-thiocytidine(32) synthetase TtcA [Clostridia bacterium]MDE7329027.1 tRNA 2-thiocytidine(32) synthetase TtcA [Clostridia bacterium]
MQKLLSLMRKALADYNMIKDGDKIAVGLSGGKDSIALLALLAAYKKFSPEKFELLAINIDLGFSDTDKSQVQATKDFCQSIGVELIIEPTQIYDIILDRQEKSPCSLCSKMRRGALNSVANAHGCNKLALGHHADDVLETFILSLIYEGRISTFMPTSFMERSNITLIRPLIYIEEKYLSGLARRYDLPIIHNPCPQDKHTKREDAKRLINELDEKYGCKNRMMTALFHPERNNLWDKIIKP